ncbi:HutD/Ves family protein [Cognaticolwellia mytili]|uniref:HutD/Ves family protein n=1 Tax=Cognaticolwellia mytili TaxID=1888913 RepID=UPI000A175105|nr:HutD family protein [Cognaticolwellia mytili]
MIEVIEPEKFRTVAWKNGKGETIEMAINSGGTLDDFSWRLSMASVVEDGIFSNFSGYTRNLILVAGDGINLQHNDSKIDKLTNLLDYATFDGGDKTVGNLHTNEITDFNVIARTSDYRTIVDCQKKAENITLEKSDLCFIYSLYKAAELSFSDIAENKTLPAGHLMKISDLKSQSTHVSGESIIIVYLNRCR